MQLDEVGRFWLAGHDDDMLSGRLTFDAGGRIELKVVGTFDHYAGPKCSIHGWIGSKQITLMDAFQTRRSLPAPGVASEAYHANFMFIGHHFTDDDLQFQSVSVEFSHLTEWVNQPGWQTSAETPTGRTIEFSLTEERSVPFSQGRISLFFREDYERGPQMYRVVVGQYPVIRLDYQQMQPLERLKEDVARIESLLILCLDTVVEADSWIVRRPDFTVRMLSGDDSGYPKDIQLLAPLIHHVPVHERQPVSTYDMLLTFDELGGLAAVARWLDESRRFQRVLEVLMSTRRRKMYMENRFLNVAGAAEAFHRITHPAIPQEEFDKLSAALMEVTPQEHREWLAGKIGFALEPSLRRRMLDLVRQSREATVLVTGTGSRAQGDWAATVAALRNWLSHVGGDGHRPDGGDMRFLSDSVYSVLRVCLLLAAGLDPSVLPALRDRRAHQLPVAIADVIDGIRNALASTSGENPQGWPDRCREQRGSSVDGYDVDVSQAS